MDTKQLHNQIMRRIYYSYGLSILTHSMLWRGVFLGAAAALLAQWLHIASIFNNFLAVPVGNIPTYITQSFVAAATHGEMITVLTIIATTAVGLSCGYRMLKVIHLERFFMRTA
jgi:hypothetical protein